MNKLILIASGASVASLAAGGAAGYLYARRRLGRQYDEQLGQELESSREFLKVKYDEELRRAYGDVRALQQKVEQMEGGSYVDDDGLHLIWMHAKDLPSLVEEEPEREPTAEEIADAERKKKSGKKALVDYGGISTGKVIQDAKPDLNGLVTKNIFDENGDEAPSRRELFADAPRKDKPVRPPRDDHGRFLPRQSDEDDESGPSDEPEEDNGDYSDEPYIITQQQFLRGKVGYEQQNVKYYILDETILGYDQEPVDMEAIGEGNLELFPPDVPIDEPSIICVRNDQNKVDYEVLLVTESLTEIMGFDDSGNIQSRYV